MFFSSKRVFVVVLPILFAIAPILCENTPQSQTSNPRHPNHPTSCPKGIHHWWPMVGMVIRTSCSFIWYKTCSFGILRFLPSFDPRVVFPGFWWMCGLFVKIWRLQKKTRVNIGHSWGKRCFSYRHQSLGDRSASFLWKAAKINTKKKQEQIPMQREVKHYHAKGTLVSCVTPNRQPKRGIKLRSHMDPPRNNKWIGVGGCHCSATQWGWKSHTFFGGFCYSILTFAYLDPDLFP